MHVCLQKAVSNKEESSGSDKAQSGKYLAAGPARASLSLKARLCARQADTRLLLFVDESIKLAL